MRTSLFLVDHFPVEVCRFARAYRCRLLADRPGVLLLRVSVPDNEIYFGILLPEAPCELFGNGYGAVPAAGTADADGEVGLAFCGVARDEEGEQSVGLLEEFPAV